MFLLRLGYISAKKKKSLAGLAQQPDLFVMKLILLGHL
jgi:hypothetical protein